MTKRVSKKRPRTLGDISDEHWKLQVVIDELEDRIKLLKQEQAALEAEAIEASKLIDDTAARVYYGKTSIGEVKTREHPKPADLPVLHAWIKKTGRFEILENRIRSTTFFELRNSGILVPGVEVFKHDVFRTRRLKEK